jgi:myo-inositol-1(or 4)-monophosphatase
VSAHAELLALAEEAARAGGALLRERYAAGPAVGVHSKSSPTDLVSQTDIDTEALIRGLLRERRPDDALMGEEGDDTPGTSGLRWVVDPLDGTIDFLYGIPQWSVSVAVEDADGRALAGVVYDPLRDELWAATIDGPPTLDGVVLQRRPAPELEAALVATGFAYQAEVRDAQAQVLTRVLPRVRDIRRFGSAALDLVWTAAGRCDAYWERGTKRWDVAAGALICERAGLVVSPLDEDGVLPSGQVVAPPELVAALRDLVA